MSTVGINTCVSSGENDVGNSRLADRSPPPARRIINDERVSDAALIAALRREIPDAFTEFVRRFQPMLTRQAARLGVRPAERETWVVELMHDVMMRLLKSETTVPKSVAGYLIRASRNKAYTQHRARTRRARYEDAAHHALCSDDHNTTQPEVDAFDSAPDGLSPPLRKLAADLEVTLTPADRELLDWTQECVPLRVIAEWLGISRAAAAQRVSRLRGRLRRDVVKLVESYDLDEQKCIHEFLGRLMDRTSLGEVP
jgi:RNA polymerase sigma factor (sigma-70 family)